MSFQAAEEWIERKLKEFNLPKTRELYHKGDEFKGIIFAKYSNTEDLHQVVQKMQRSSFKLGQKQFWCKPDRSLELRAGIISAWSSTPTYPLGIIHERCAQSERRRTHHDRGRSSSAINFNGERCSEAQMDRPFVGIMDRPARQRRIAPIG